MADEQKQIFKKGDALMWEGDRGDCAYIIESGNVEILVKREDRLVQIGTRGPGSIIGEMAMIDDRPRTATVCALDDCTVTRLSREDFARRVDNADPVVKMVLHVILTRYRDLMSRTQFIQFPHTQNSHAETSENMTEAHDLAVGSLKIHSELKNALEKEELRLFYQPILDLETLKVAGFEALMRWEHPEKGLLSPALFIPVAEDSGFIVEMTRWAMGSACAALKEMQDAGSSTIRKKSELFVSINFSAQDFEAEGTFEHIEKTLKQHNVAAKNIHMEVTESLLMRTPERAKEVLEQCQTLGLHTSIDDFGSGYSSLSYLHYFPINTLKIDQSFIRAMHEHDVSRVLVTSIIALARNLNMEIIAEGIETVEDAKILRDLGSHLGQGYFFAKPMPLTDSLNFLKSWDPPIF